MYIEDDDEIEEEGEEEKESITEASFLNWVSFLLSLNHVFVLRVLHSGPGYCIISVMRNEKEKVEAEEEKE